MRTAPGSRELFRPSNGDCANPSEHAMKSFPQIRRATLGSTPNFDTGRIDDMAIFRSVWVPYLETPETPETCLGDLFLVETRLDVSEGTRGVPPPWPPGRIDLLHI